MDIPVTHSVVSQPLSADNERSGPASPTGRAPAHGWF